MKPLKIRKRPGPVIFQLPPRFHKNIERLEKFLNVLPGKQRFAIEFRDPDWHQEDVYRLLRKHKIAFCLFEKGKLHSPRLTTANFVYVRLHGRIEGYRGNYSDKALQEWHRWLRDQDKDVYIFFDNTEQKRYALDNALSFKELITHS